MTEMSQFIDRFIPGGFLAHLSTIVGFLLAIFFFARLMHERRAPANTFAWMLVVVFIPWLGVPLYLIFGGRKLRRLRAHGTLPGPSAKMDLDGTPRPWMFRRLRWWS